MAQQQQEEEGGIDFVDASTFHSAKTARLFFRSQRAAFLDHVETLPDFLSPQEVAQVIEGMGAHDPDSFQRAVVGTDQDTRTEESIRRSKVKWIPQTHEWGWLYEKIAKALDHANYTWWQFTVVGFDEDIQLSRYEGQERGNYHFHLDCGSGYSSTRKISMIIQLSDESEYQGGGVEFFITKAPFQIPRKKGTAIIFPSYLLHRVNEVTRGVRMSLVVWLHGPAFA